MSKEDTILKIKQLEVESQTSREQAEKDGLAMVADARSEVIALVEQFEKEREPFIEKALENVRTKTEEEAGKIIEDAEKNAKKLEKSASVKMAKVVNNTFNNFKKNILDK